MNLLILLTLPEKIALRYHDHLKATFPELNVTYVNHHSKVDATIADTDILITFGAMMNDQVLEKATKLKWIQALGTGVDGITDRPALRDGVLVTNLHGKHGPPMSESAITSMLVFSRDMRRVLRNQDRAKYERFPARLINGKTVGIFGVGTIAAELAPRCKALGMTVAGITSAKRTVPGFDRMHGVEELEQVVRELDFLVLLTPYSKKTHGIIGEKVLAAMKPTSILINLARGGVVDDAALIEALATGRIAGAALDVFTEEPLPEDHPFWKMDNVIVTPHLGGFHVGYVDEALPVLEENVRKFIAGDIDHMLNIVMR